MSSAVGTTRRCPQCDRMVTPSWAPPGQPFRCGGCGYQGMAKGETLRTAKTFAPSLLKSMPAPEQSSVEVENGGFREVYFHRMRYFLSPQFDVYKNIRRSIYEHFRMTQARILDYGCGNGFGSMLLASRSLHAEVVAYDKDEEAAAFAEDAFGHLVKFRCGDWSRAPGDLGLESAGYFDVITCIEVIEHLKSPKVLLENLRSALHDDGVLFLSTVNHNSQFRKNRGHIGKFSVADFRSLLLDFFPTVSVRDYTLWCGLDDESSISPMVAVVRKVVE